MGISKMSDVRKTFADMKKRLNKKGSGFKGILLEKMVPKGVELIVGVQNDPQFGPVIMVGMGGIMTEVMKDVAFRMLPINPERRQIHAGRAERRGAARRLPGERPRGQEGGGEDAHQDRQDGPWTTPTTSTA